MGTLTEDRGNLLTEPLITLFPAGHYTLPGVLAALASDRVDSFPALRPHQQMFWHMFLVQLACLALHNAGETTIPEDEGTWRQLLRRLTPDYPKDEPWTLLVADWKKPAFLQAAVPDGCKMEKGATTPDSLDLLITSKNHDLKQAIAHDCRLEHWLFALVSLQTGEGYNGSGNQGIARMNGGSSSRPMVTLAPLPQAGRCQEPRLGAWFKRDTEILLESRKTQPALLDYADKDGLGLVWLSPWPEGQQLETRQLDRWFIEICRRVRLQQDANGNIFGCKGTSAATRINAKHLKGALEDPWAPTHKTEGKNFTLAEGRFDYTTVSNLLFSGEWALPVLAKVQKSDEKALPFTIVTQALARGNSKTDGFQYRLIPISGKAVIRLGGSDPTLWQMAKAQTEIIASFNKILRNALALIAAGGEAEQRKREHYRFADKASTRLIRFADTIFFPHLWESLEGKDGASLHTDLIRNLWQETQQIFEKAQPAIPCSSFARPRAEARARRALRSSAMCQFGSDLEEKTHAA